MRLTLTLLLAAFSFLLILVTGCTGVKPLKPGNSTITTPGQSQTITQSENPASVSTQAMETAMDEDYTVPAGSELTTTKSTATETNIVTVKPTQPMPVSKRESHKASASVGPSQPDTARDLAAKFAAVRPVQYVGILLILVAGVLAYFQWWTKAAIVGGVGLGMIIVASIIPGHELAILGVGLAVAAIGAFVVLYVYHKATLDTMVADAEKALHLPVTVKTPSAPASTTTTTPAVVVEGAPAVKTT